MSSEPLQSNFYVKMTVCIQQVLHGVFINYFVKFKKNSDSQSCNLSNFSELEKRYQIQLLSTSKLHGQSI